MIHPYFSDIEHNFCSEPYVRFASTAWPTVPLTIGSVYLLFIMVAPRVMKHRKAFELKQTVATWNFLLTVFSFCGMVRVVPYCFLVVKTNSFHEIICLYPEYLDHGVVAMWSMLFVFSKVVELFDTVFLVLAKKQLVFLHWYHHLTVLLLSWHAYISKSTGSIFFMAMNYSIHAVMYGYYFLKSIEQWPRGLSPQFITIAQVSQMILGSFICFKSLFYKIHDRKCFVYMSNTVWATIIYSSYLYLFVQFFVKKFLQTKSKVN